MAGTIPTNVPTMYPWQGKMGGNGGKWGEMGENGGEMGGNGGKWGKIRKLGWCNRSPFPPFPPHFLPIFPHFPPFSPIFPHFSSGAFPIFSRFSSGAFTNAPPHSLVANLNLDFSAPKFPIFPLSNLNFPHLPPFSPIFPTLAHFPDSVPLNVPKLGTSEPSIIVLCARCPSFKGWG